MTARTKEQLEALSILDLEVLMTEIHNERKQLLQEQQIAHDVLEAKEIDIELGKKIRLSTLSPAEKARAQVLIGSLIQKEDSVHEGGAS